MFGRLSTSAWRQGPKALRQRRKRSAPPIGFTRPNLPSAAVNFIRADILIQVSYHPSQITISWQVTRRLTSGKFSHRGPSRETHRCGRADHSDLLGGAVRVSPRLFQDDLQVEGPPDPLDLLKRPPTHRSARGREDRVSFGLGPEVLSGLFEQALPDVGCGRIPTWTGRQRCRTMRRRVD